MSVNPEMFHVAASVATLASVVCGIYVVNRNIKRDERDDGEADGEARASLVASIRNAESSAQAASTQIAELRKENSAAHEKIHGRIDKASADTTQQIRRLPCTDHTADLRAIKAIMEIDK